MGSRGRGGRERSATIRVDPALRPIHPLLAPLTTLEPYLADNSSFACSKLPATWRRCSARCSNVVRARGTFSKTRRRKRRRVITTARPKRSFVSSRSSLSAALEIRRLIRGANCHSTVTVGTRRSTIALYMRRLRTSRSARLLDSRSPECVIFANLTERVARIFSISSRKYSVRSQTSLQQGQADISRAAQLGMLPATCGDIYIYMYVLYIGMLRRHLAGIVRG